MCKSIKYKAHHAGGLSLEQKSPHEHTCTAHVSAAAALSEVSSSTGMKIRLKMNHRLQEAHRTVSPVARAARRCDDFSDTSLGVQPSSSSNSDDDDAHTGSDPPLARGAKRARRQ